MFQSSKALMVIGRQTRCWTRLKIFTSVPWALSFTSSSLRESTFSSSCLFFCSTFCRYSVKDLILASCCSKEKAEIKSLVSFLKYQHSYTNLVWEHSGFYSAHLRDAKLAGCQFLLILIHLLVALRLCALKLLAALRHGLYFRLHLADVETGHCELFVYHAAAAFVLLVAKEEK